MSADRDVVVEVLAGQSPGYFIFPNAAAFAAAGLGPDDVAATLDELHAEGMLEREMLVAGDGGDDGELVPGGYRLKSKPTRRRKKS